MRVRSELTTIAMLMAAPPTPFVPAERHGELAFIVMLVHAGDPDAGQAAVAPYRDVAAPLGEMVAPMPYPAIYEFTKGGGQRGSSVTRSLFLDTLDDTTIDTMLRFTSSPSSPLAMTQIRILGGAMSRVPATATAFAHRDAGVMVALITPFAEAADAPAHVAWTDEYLAALQPAATGVYANFLSDEGEARVREAYPGVTYQRLAQVKRRYDPDNLFRLNQNIRP